jgi:6-phosphofructokinase 1
MATRRVGILTAGGDSPGLNATIRGFGKAAIGTHGYEVIGFRDGFRGLAEDRRVRLDKKSLAGILTVGGTILGTSRDKPHKMLVDGEVRDMTGAILDVCRRHELEGVVCLGGGGTAKNALRLWRAGLNVLTLPKTIDNDVAGTDATFGFATALEIATEAIDRLHSTAHSHHRVIVAEVMGHQAGWLALGAGLAGGADVILIPEIPYQVSRIATAIKERVRKGSGFSIVAVAEGARSVEDAKALETAEARLARVSDPVAREAIKAEIVQLELQHQGNTFRLAHQLELLTGLESRVSILGYVQRGGTPSAADRLLATRLGTAAADFVAEGTFGIMVAAHGDGVAAVPLEDVAGRRNIVPADHPWLTAARHTGTCLGD